MISNIKGIILHKDPRFIIIDTGGVGYKVFTTSDTINNMKSSKEISIWTHLAVRENALDLYGFLSLEELNFF